MTTGTMTAQQATAFDRQSATNATILRRSLNCGCEPYVDVFTYNRWKAQGHQVQRGEHAVNLALIKVIEHEDDNGEITKRRIFANSNVFCRCQVKTTGNA